MFIVKIIALLISLGIVISSAYLFIYFVSYKYQLCVPITNCTYELVDSWSTFGDYYYVINGKISCEFLCEYNKDASICPINGSECHMNQKIFDYCNGDLRFEPLVSCRNFGEKVLLPSSMLIICLLFILISIMLS